MAELTTLDFSKLEGVTPVIPEVETLDIVEEKVEEVSVPLTQSSKIDFQN